MGDKNGGRKQYIQYLCDQTVVFYNTFNAQFLDLWNKQKDEENGGNLIPETIGNDDMIKKYQLQFMEEIWNDSIKFAGIILIRRTLGIADGPEFRINKERNKERWNAEEKAVRFGWNILNDTVNTDSIQNVVDALKQYL